MQCDGSHPLGRRNPSGVKVGLVVLVDADPHLDRHRDVAPGALLDDGRDDRPEKVALPREGRAATLAGHLGHRAAEVEVDVVGAVLLHEDSRGRPGRHRVDGVELHRARLLVGVVLDQAHRLGVALDQCARGDHLRDVEAVAAELPAQPPEGSVGDARHRRQDDRGRDGMPSKLQGRQRRSKGSRHPPIVSASAAAVTSRRHQLRGLWPAAGSLGQRRIASRPGSGRPAARALGCSHEKAAKTASMPSRYSVTASDS